MPDESCAAPATSRPIANMRITFWGVQGSCPIFPSPCSLREYAQRLAVYTLAQAVEDLHHAPAGTTGSLEALLGGPPTRERIEAYQHRIGLPDMPLYGGETTCVELETNEGNILLFDAGSGLRRCSSSIVHRWKDRQDRTLHLFGTHEHLDHRNGFTFAWFNYLDRNPFTIHVRGSRQFLQALDCRYGLFSHQVSEATYLDDPVDYTHMPAKFTALELRAGNPASGPPSPYWPVQDLSPIRIGRTTVTPFEVYHATLCCLAYKVEHDGKTFVFCTDHERRRGAESSDPRQQKSDAAEARVRQHCRDVDLAYFDGQYFLDEYLGKKGIGSSPPACRMDWGHSCIEDAIERARECHISRTLVGHHDPERTWPQRAEMDRLLAEISRGQPYQLQLADGEAVVHL